MPEGGSLGLEDLVGLDFGCAYGHLLRYMAGDMALAYGMDIPGSLLEEARKTSAACSNIIIQEVNTPPDSRHQPLFDLITVNSTIQYLCDLELRRWLPWWLGSLSPRGCLILSDIYPRKSKLWNNFWGMIMWGQREHCLVEVLREFVVLIRMGYFKFVHYGRDPEELTALINECGGDVTILPKNIDILQARYSLIIHLRACPGMKKSGERDPVAV